MEVLSVSSGDEQEHTEPFYKRAWESDERLRANQGSTRGLSEAEHHFAKRVTAMHSNWGALKKIRGPRYEACRFANYEIGSEDQKKVVDRLRDFAASKDALNRNVVLVGPTGTGKDHLLMALAHEVANQHGAVPLWVNGCEFYSYLQRESFEPGTRIHDEERVLTSVSASYFNERTTSILWISDPLPPSGVLSEFKQQGLFSVVDFRYSRLLPVWTTMNVANASEAETRIGTQTVDRLQDGALVLVCDWDSYRKPKD